MKTAFTETELAGIANTIWNRNPMRRQSHRFALFASDGQFHGTFNTDCDAQSYIVEHEETPCYIANGYQIIKFR